MNAKSSKKSSKNNDIKIAIIIIMFCVLGIALLWILNRSKNEHKITLKKPVVVTKKKTVAVPVAVVPPAELIKNTNTSAANGIRIAFVIDDWGYSIRNCSTLAAIHDPIAVAILPNLPHTQDVIQCASKAKKDIMLHLPMQPYINRDKYPDNYLLTTTMSPNKVESILESIFKSMPQIIGVNNHMGSKAMEDKRLLKLVFRHLKKHRLFFIDSMTSPSHSFGKEVANEIGLPFGQRDVFLDNINTKEAILKQFDELVRKATKKGYAIAIGHDRDLTMRTIKEQIVLLKKRGFKIVSINELL